MRKAVTAEDSIELVVSRLKSYKIRQEIVKKLGARICELLGLKGWDLCIRFVGKTSIKRLNSMYRGKDYATDVLSFPQTEWKKPVRLGAKSSPKTVNFKMLGDIVICLDLAKKNAEGIGQGLDREVCFLIVHGILHLCGHDHEIKSEERVMFKEQKKIIEALSRNPRIWRHCVSEQPLGS